MSLDLPTLTLQAKAELISNNLPAFEEAFKSGLDSLKYELLDESDFAKAKDDIKALKEAETVCKAMNEAILNGSADLKDARETLENLAEEARQMRLSREKEIKSRDTEIKAGYIQEALDIPSDKLPTAKKRIEDAMKGKKTFPTLRKAAYDEAYEIQSEIDAVDAVLGSFDESLQHGRGDLLLKSPDAVVAIMEQRKAAQEAAIREAKLKEEADKLKAEAAEQAAKQEAAIREATPIPEPKEEPPAQVVYAPSIDKIPVEGERAESQLEEAARISSILIEAFGGFKEARMKLKHEKNFAAADNFAKKVNVAYLTFKEETK